LSNDSRPTGSNTDEAQRLPEPSMGPACLVVCILTLAVFIAFCSISSFFMFSDQPALAERGITEQLIPWIESSNLAAGDKQIILADLHETVDQVRSRQLTTRQLTRLKSVLEDNPVLLWGNVEGVLGQAASVGLTDVEQAASVRVAQRLLRAAGERKLGRNDLVYALEPCTHTRPDGQGLEVNTPLTSQQIQAFLGRAERFVDGMQIANEPFEKTPPEVFRGLLDEALAVK